MYIAIPIASPASAGLGGAVVAVSAAQVATQGPWNPSGTGSTYGPGSQSTFSGPIAGPPGDSGNGGPAGGMGTTCPSVLRSGYGQPGKITSNCMTCQQLNCYSTCGSPGVPPGLGGPCCSQTSQAVTADCAPG